MDQAHIMEGTVFSQAKVWFNIYGGAERKHGWW